MKTNADLGEKGKARCAYMVSSYGQPALKYRCSKPVAAPGEEYCKQHIAKLERDQQKCLRKYQSVAGAG